MDRRATARLGPADPSIATRSLALLILDASVVVFASATVDGFAFFDDDLAGPPLLWSEVRSALHEAAWRGEIARDDAVRSLEAFAESKISERKHRRLGETAWRIADQLGFAKTYDAEYLALAELLDCRLVTVDGRLRRGAERLGYVVTPAEL